MTRASAAILRVGGRPSVYLDRCEDIISRGLSHRQMVGATMGIVTSLRADVAAGYLQSYAGLVHGELFADFLDMSQHLLDEGFKDAAAVVAGSSLEAHLRKLCQMADIDTEEKSATGTRQKRAERLNSDLTAANVYTKLDQKNVTAWLGIRNKAAHGEYDQYQAEQVALLIASIRNFITRNPA